LPNVKVVNVAGATSDSQNARRVSELAGANAVPPALVHESVDLVLEAATGAAALEILPGIWNAGTDTVVISIGALLQPGLAARMSEFRAAGGRVIHPAGAIAGLDGVRAMAARGGLKEAGIMTTKTPASLRGAPYVVENGIELPDNVPMQVFSGNAREAAIGFPANVNVAAALSLAGIGPDATTVQIYSDPKAKVTAHVIHAEGDSGELEVRLKLKPSPGNPRTSYLAALSAISTLQELSQSINAAR